MNTQEVSIASFLKELMRRRKRLPSQLAADLSISHATVSRWLSGADVPSIKSCQRIAEYSGVPLEKILSVVGHLPRIAEVEYSEWPEFREYAQRKYPAELSSIGGLHINILLPERVSQLSLSIMTRPINR